MRIFIKLLKPTGCVEATETKDILHYFLLLSTNNYRKNVLLKILEIWLRWPNATS